MLSYRHKALTNVLWNFTEQILSKGISVFTTMILAWFLVPEDYALVAMLAVVIELSTTLVEAGLGQALIRKIDVNEDELSTVFWTNIFLATFIYGITYVLAPYIANFYDESKLISLIRVVGLSVFFYSLIVVQKVILVRSLNFKLQAKIALPAALLSSVVAILLAKNDYGVWALIVQILLKGIFSAVLYWFYGGWRPASVYRGEVMVDLWGFSKYIVIDSFVQIPFKNIYLIVLPKYFSAGPVGLYFFSEKIKEMVIRLIVNSVQKVTYPMLSQMQEDHKKLKRGFRQVIAVTSLLMCPMMFFLAALAPSFFGLLLPDQWQGAVVYLQLMCLAALLYPIHAINVNILKVKGRSDLMFVVGVINKLVTITIFVFTIQFGMVEVVVGQIIASIINVAPNIYYSSRLIGYTAGEQLADFLPSIGLSGLIAGLVYYLQDVLVWGEGEELLVLIVLASMLYVGGAGYIKLNGYKILREIIREKLYAFRRAH